MKNPRYDILFEPVRIGPVTARNRFYQVPHCNGLGHLFPKGEASMRGMKAQGGWAVVSTQEVDIHPSTDVSPYIEGRLWDREDMKRLQLMVDAVHEHGSLAAIEITHNGHASTNRHSRLPTMAVAEMLIDGYDPVQSYAMTKQDIANVRRWHRRAALRSREIGFDIIYVYAAHDLALPFHFISPNRNTRTDEYGGSLENRVRLLREILEDTKDAVGDTCGIALRFAVDEMMGNQGIVAENEGREVIEMLAEHPDIWDVNISDWQHDSQSSRFSGEGFQEPYTAFVKQVTSKPVVGVGRFTSPDTMVSQIRRGILDMIGAARPSIADPFLPKKIEEGRLEDIRECIGCNICVSGDMTVSPIRCTQNPTMAEEYRKGWHPESIEPRTGKDAVLIVGAGPAGLEAAMSLGKRGYPVTVADAGENPGGRVDRESRLPGLSAWKRVVDYRMGQIEKLDNVEVHLQSALTPAQILEFAGALGVQHVVCATGSRWDPGGIGRQHRQDIPRSQDACVVTPDDVMAGTTAFRGPVVVYDDDHYYMGGVIAKALVRHHTAVTLVTPAADVSTWTHNTLEQRYIERHLLDCGVRIIEKHELKSIATDALLIAHCVSGTTQSLEAGSVVMVTARRPQESLFFELEGDRKGLEAAGIKSVSRIGDCLAPSTIADAVYQGHRFAREFGRDLDPDRVPYRREYVQI
ncbi:MAG: NAD(P)-binding protein [Gammaproteobacteria bacterium]|nr:NAD(P)-binding protein [Gammaproteobacteria bacterium]